MVVEEVAPPAEEPAVEEAPEIVALDEGGAVLPLASEEAAETVATGDPYFKDGAIYRGWHNGGGCPAIVTICSFSLTGNPLQDAIAAYSLTATGPIYIEGDTYTFSSNLVINGTLRPELADMTGLIGTGSGVVNLVFNAAFNLQVTNTTAGFTLQGMNISGNAAGPLVNIYTNTGSLTLTDLIIKNNPNTNGTGLQVLDQTGNVTLNTIKADLNGDQGASITGITGNVTINNSSFDSNSQGGSGTGKNSLKVDAAGTITLNGVSASNFPRGNGAWLESDKGITVKNSLFNGNYDTTDNNDWGIWSLYPSYFKRPGCAGPCLC